MLSNNFVESSDEESRMLPHSFVAQFCFTSFVATTCDGHEANVTDCDFC